MKPEHSRREFLEQMGIGTAGLLAGGYTAKAGGFPQNETIQIGIIGAGGRARQLMQRLAAIPGVRLTAVCDIYDPFVAEARKLAAPGAFVTKDHLQLLERSDVDAVIIGSPDHWHVPMTVDACAAGKDVFVEKPLTHKISEGPAVIDAQKRHQRIVQVGTQQRSMPQFIQAREILRAGTLGPIRKVRMTWNRNHTPYEHRVPEVHPEQVDWKRFLGGAPEQPFDAYRFRHWRWFWDFGGGILTDLMVHWLDAVQFLMDIGVPSEITTIGDHLSTKGVWETPDTIQTLMRYPEQGLQVHFEGTFVNQHHKAMVELMGEDATLYLDRGRMELHPEPGRKVGAREVILGGARGGDFSTVDGETLHLNDWLEAVRSRRPPSAPAEAGVLAAKVAHLGNQAYRESTIVCAS